MRRPGKTEPPKCDTPTVLTKEGQGATTASRVCSPDSVSLELSDRTLLTGAK